MLGPAGIAENLGPDNINAELGKPSIFYKKWKMTMTLILPWKKCSHLSKPHTAPNTPEQEQPKQDMYISCHAAEGTTGPSTFSLLLMIDGKQAVALVDSG